MIKKFLFKSALEDLKVYLLNESKFKPQSYAFIFSAFFLVLSLKLSVYPFCVSVLAYAVYLKLIFLQIKKLQKEIDLEKLQDFLLYYGQQVNSVKEFSDVRLYLFVKSNVMAQMRDLNKVYIHWKVLQTPENMWKFVINHELKHLLQVQQDIWCFTQEEKSVIVKDLTKELGSAVFADLIFAEIDADVYALSCLDNKITVETFELFLKRVLDFSGQDIQEYLKGIRLREKHLRKLQLLI